MFLCWIGFRFCGFVEKISAIIIPVAGHFTCLPQTAGRLGTFSLTHDALNQFSGKTQNVFALSIFSQHRDGTASWWNYSSMEVKDLHIFYSQYHGSWCPGDARHQGINSHGIDLVSPECSGFNMRRVNTLVPGWHSWNPTDLIFNFFFHFFFTKNVLNITEV